MFKENGDYFTLKKRALTLPKVDVKKEEFVSRLLKKGEIKEKAEQIATVTQLLGSRIEINNEMVGIKIEYV
jgi:hypothetical protein